MFGSRVVLTIACFRYGEDTQYDNHHPLLRTLTIPSAFLGRQRLEILIHETGIPTIDSTDFTTSSQERLTDILVPTLATPSSAAGRVSTVTYPVHKSILYGHGLSALEKISIATSGMAKEHRSMVHGVVNVTWSEVNDDSSMPSVSLVNVKEGEEAIDSLRESLNNSSIYEHRWLASNLSSLATFLSTGSTNEGTSLKLVIKDLIYTVISHVEEAISLAESHQTDLLNRTTVTTDVRRSLDSAISYWAELAHTELRYELDNVFQGPSWRKLKWWKLPWRVDDVGMMASEVLQRAYLVEAEKGMIWVSGRLQQAGLTTPFQPSLNEPDNSKLFYVNVPVLSVKEILSDMDPKSHHYRTAVQPWPLQIAKSRANLLLETLPPLQATAQRLLLEALSTTSIGFAVSLVIYLSASNPNIYEAGAVATLALTWSARRLQVNWENAKLGWTEKLKVDGKQVLDIVERASRTIVETGGRPNVDMVGVGEREQAKRIVTRIKAALGNHK